MESTPSPEKPSQDNSDPLPAELRQQLLTFLGDRLSAGEVLVSPAQWNQAIVEGYQALKGSFPSQEVRERLEKIVGKVNAENPQILAVPAVENWLAQALMSVVRRNGWGVTEIMEQGNQALRDLVRQDKVKALLGQLGLNVRQLNQSNCLRAVTNQVAGREDPQRVRARARLAQALAAKKSAGPAGSGGRENHLEELLAGPASQPDEAEAESRRQQEKKNQARLRSEQMQHLIDNLQAYVQAGRIAPEEAERLRKVHKIEEAVRRGQVSAEKGSKVRNSILTGKVRDRIERKVREEVDYVVVYTQVFEALQRIDPRYDQGLRFLVRHKEAVNADEREGDAWKEAIGGLIEDLDALRLLIGMMDRQDAEVRMMAARLPPYSYVVRRGHERLEKVVVDETFLDALRQVSGDEIRQRLGDPDRKQRAQLAASMLSINALISRLIKPTPFRKEIRILKLNLIVEEFYRDTEDVEEARKKAQEFLRTRLKKIYPDLSEDESAEIEERSNEIIAAVEKKVLAEREQEKQQQKEQGEAGAEEGGEDLSKEEEEKGVQIGRVALRATGGGTRLVPYKIMRDEEDASRFVLVKRDPESGELVPIRRRGSKRYVEKNREGVWEVI